MNESNKYGERHGSWVAHWSSSDFNLKKPRYIWKGQYNNGSPIGLFQYFFYNRKVHTKEFYL